MTTFPLPNLNSLPQHIVSAPDGNLYFTLFARNELGQVNLSGAAKSIGPNADPVLRFTNIRIFATGQSPFDLTVIDNTASYDAAGRLIRVDYGNGKGFIYRYDAKGNLLSRAPLSSAPTRTRPVKRGAVTPKTEESAPKKVSGASESTPPTTSPAATNVQ